MKSHLSRIVIEEDDDGCHAFCPALKGCHTWGKSPGEAYEYVQEAIQAYVESMLKRGETAPARLA